MSDDGIDTFLRCDKAIQRGHLIHGITGADKESYVQNWFQKRLSCRGVYESKE